MSRPFATAAIVFLAASASADTVTLKSEAAVRGPKVLLGDVADVEGENAESLKAVELFPAPSPGSSRSVDAALVDARIRSAGHEGVELAGAESTKATRLALQITPDMLREDLRRFIETEMPWDPADATVSVDVPEQPILVPDGEVEVRWRPNTQYGYAGDGAFRGEIRIDGALRKTVLCKATVEAYGDVVVAARDLSAGKPIGPTDVTVEKRVLSETSKGLVNDPAEVVGGVSRSSVRAGQPIQARGVVSPTLIKRGQLVKVELHVGGLKINARAKAKGDGREGDLLACENVESKELFQGVVRKDGVVVVE